jgi:hypothetical protein
MKVPPFVDYFFVSLEPPQPWRHGKRVTAAVTPLCSARAQGTLAGEQMVLPYDGGNESAREKLFLGHYELFGSLPALEV